MWDALIHLYAYLAVLPALPFAIAFAAGRYWTRDRKRAFKLAMDVSTVFLIGIVGSLINQLTGSGFGLYLILLLLLLGAGLLGNAQNRARGKVDARKLIRAVWRIAFFALAPLYVVLMLIYLIDRAI